MKWSCITGGAEGISHSRLPQGHFRIFSAPCRRSDKTFKNLDNDLLDKPIGVMRIDLFPATFFEPFDGMQYLGNGILVVDQNGNPIVDNNLYTNLLAQENLYAALRSLGILGKDANKLNITDTEKTFWKKVADNMYLPYDEKLGVYLQDDG